VNLISMKKAKESEEPSAPQTGADEEYPYGLSLSLETDQIKALSAEGLSVGDEVMITAKAVVKSRSESEYEKGEDYKTLSLQVTDMMIGGDEDDKSDILYPDVKK
jgi:hypothetical protein